MAPSWILEIHPSLLLLLISFRNSYSSTNVLTKFKTPTTQSTHILYQRHEHYRQSTHILYQRHEHYKPTMDTWGFSGRDALAPRLFKS